MVSVISYHGGQRRQVREGLGKEATDDHGEHKHVGLEGLSLSEVAKLRTAI